MIRINKCPKASTLSCDFANVSKEELLESSVQHIKDVGMAMKFFMNYMGNAAKFHDLDKITNIDWFHKDFITGFSVTEWWDNHRKINRHHLAQEDGIPDDVNLMDVMEYIADCIIAGMARRGEVYELMVLPDLLEKAFENTVKLLKAQVEIVSPEEAGEVSNETCDDS